MRVSFLQSRMSSTFHTMHNAPDLCPTETCQSSLVRYDIADTCSACARIEIPPVFIQSACVCIHCEKCVLCFLYVMGRMTISVLTFPSMGLYMYRDTESNSEHQAWLDFPFFMKLALFPWQDRALLAFWLSLGSANCLEMIAIAVDSL